MDANKGEPAKPEKETAKKFTGTGWAVGTIMRSRTGVRYQVQPNGNWKRIAEAGIKGG